MAPNRANHHKWFYIKSLSIYAYLCFFNIYLWFYLWDTIFCVTVELSQLYPSLLLAPCGFPFRFFRWSFNFILLLFQCFIWNTHWYTWNTISIFWNIDFIWVILSPYFIKAFAKAWHLIDFFYLLSEEASIIFSEFFWPFSFIWVLGQNFNLYSSQNVFW